MRKHEKILKTLPRTGCGPYTNMRRRYERWIEKNMKAYKVLEEIEIHLQACEICEICGKDS